MELICPVSGSRLWGHLTLLVAARAWRPYQRWWSRYVHLLDRGRAGSWQLHCAEGPCGCDYIQEGVHRAGGFNADTVFACLTNVYHCPKSHLVSVFVYGWPVGWRVWIGLPLSLCGIVWTHPGNWPRVCFGLWYCIEVTALPVTLSWRNLSIVWWQRVFLL